MKQVILIVLVILGLVTVQSLSDENIVIGVYTQSYWYPDHKATTDGKVLTYIAPTYANIGWMAGAKIVPIYSYISKDEIITELGKVNGVIFTGGQEHIYINTTWTTNAHVILEYAKKQNDAGNTFPILGICQGLELMLYLTSDMRVDFLDRIQNQSQVFNTIQLTSQKFYLIDGISDRALAAITDAKNTVQGGTLFFSHSNGTLLSTFQRDSDLNSFWNLVGTTSKGNQTFVSYLEAKNYPFYITQFHPQRLYYNSSFSDRLIETRIQLVNMIGLNFVKKCRKSLNRYPKEQLERNIIDNVRLIKSKVFYYDVYLFEETGPLQNKSMHAEGLSGVGDIIGFILVVALIISVLYYLYAKRKNEQNGQNQSLAQQIQKDQFRT